ncbi:rod shape-determining protein MreC [Bordetella trematum]|uniref:Cell shape-determining protein MreC n=1 Tax=Bordetella trematum TaxID=123899 RepID=A0A157M7X4_9BORD|nr:rod shape-determining protein MreC [Bordetella trematum]AUL48655.1 rod shape-determining protein MreC [Bordetella trematum]AZR95604.1 rod shape-determining protein MreC [Bordetella trematum]NNH20837.1 rod shape-determining protein MreC [Bordetella trematum]QIM70576.1 rod shape-determining protein MreC [Bordetella trematum]SAI04866.1 rod shape-determining protein MreC [Bordetella trematum]
MQRQSTPPLFRRGPPAEVRLAVLVVLALVLIVVDSQMRILEPVRNVVAQGLYPFQRAVLWPRDAVQRVDEWINAANRIRTENEALQRQRIELSQVATHAAQLAAENAQLRRLLGVTDTVGQPATVVEVLYEPPNAFHQRLVFNKGSEAGIAPGMPVIDEGGVVGQIVRVTPMTAEAAMVTDERVSIPVQVLRNGLRLIAFGSNTPGVIEVRYLAANADLKAGDTIVTSGVGGLFPAGLPVARITTVERDTASGFARALAEPLAHPERYRHFLVLQVDVAGAEANRQEADLGTP